MANPPPRSRERAVAILLFCALCGVLLGLGARALRLRAAGPRPAPREPGGRARPGPRSAAVPDGGARPLVVPDRGGVDGGVQAGGRAVSVLVLDGRGQPVAGVQVVARLEVQPSELGSAPSPRAPARPTTAAGPVGELGVLRGPLPFPEEIISGAYLVPGALQRGSSDGGVTATTDSKGGARLFPVPPGRVQLLATLDTKSAAAEILVPATPPAAGPESEAAALRIVLRLGAAPESLCTLPGEPGDAPEPLAPAGEGPEVAGRVEDGRGFPLGGARLELTSGRTRTLSISDPRGGFAVRGLPAGAVTITVRHPGYAPLTLTQAADKPRGDLRLQLQPGGGVSGTVRDARVGGLPPGAQLVAESSGGGRQPITLLADGRFLATGLAPGELTLRARAPGYAPLVLTVRVPAGESKDQVTLPDLRLELARSASLHGRVRGPDGVAVGAVVTLTLSLPGGQERPLGQQITDERGEFSATDLPPGSLRLHAVAGSTSARTEIELTAGDSARTELELR